MISVVLVGAGNRANHYAKYALEAPDKMKVVGIVDPDEVRLNIMREKYSVPVENCFSSVDKFMKRDRFADAVINGTMDHLHVQTSIPILEKGYDMLLEKPFAVNEKEAKELVEVVKRTGRKVYICHVLRYTPFYAAIKKHLLNGDIGKIIGIQHNEHVSFHHMAVSYVRGKWRSEKECFAPMLLAKSCHDIDIMVWMLSDSEPVMVSSFGSDFQFGKSRKPHEAGSRCMLDCPQNEECVFSAEYNYVEPQRWEQYVWKALEKQDDFWGEAKPLDDEHKEILKESLKCDNLFGKCVWDFERDGNVDHQCVTVNFQNGATGVFSMMGGTAKSERNIHIVGTKGEIKGEFSTQEYILRTIDPKEKTGYREEVYNTQITGDFAGERGGHGGGDIRLIADFCNALETGETSISCTDIMDSIKSHMIVFKAEEARKTNKIVTI